MFGFTSFSNRLIYKASSWNGCKEDPGRPNRSHCVDEIHEYMGHEPKPDPWCAKFVTMIIDQTCKEFGITNPIGLTASTHYLLNRAKTVGIRTDKKPEPGCVFFYSRGSGTGHVGFVNYVKGDELITIEGNFGDEVAFGKRKLNSKNFTYIHVQDLNPGIWRNKYLWGAGAIAGIGGLLALNHYNKI